ncbi:MAG: GIY-YIG nuclease family protein [Roseiarcus sp.]
MNPNLETSKRRILNEIRRTAEANGGVALGVARFSQATGIKDSDWRGKIWPRWGNAIREAGFQPNQLQAAYDEKVLIEKFIELARELGHFPVATEIKMKARSDEGFPCHNTFGRFGPRQQVATKILDYCKGRAGYEDVAALCGPIAERLGERQQPKDPADAPSTNSSDSAKEGYLYLGLLKLGREKRYKIGKAVLVERRRDQISLQLPEDLELVHAITTDDAYGIEEYWHKRFAAKNTKGEWFSLSRQDVESFKRRKFM